MYCPQCDCEYAGWNNRCPVCKTILLDAQPSRMEQAGASIDYETFVDQVRVNGGTLTIEMSTTDIENKKGREFPYIGRGYAWTQRMIGSCDEYHAALTTTEVGRDRGWTFPYFGYGFAWEKEMQGDISGNPLTLQADKVAREQKMAFPYAGFGRAWVQSMSGECGDQLKATLTVTEVRQRNKRGFPYFGFGFAWPSMGELTLTLSNSAEKSETK